MIRKFNYTDRKKIPSRFIKIQKLKSGREDYFIASLNFSNLGFPPEAKLYIEAYYNANYVRYYYGTVANQSAPGNTSLNELPEVDDVRFRVKVVDESGRKGRIIGTAVNILADNNPSKGKKESILPVKFANLNHQIWKVEFDIDGQSGPVLVFNNENNLKEISIKAKNDPHYLSLVYPIAIRMVLQKIKEEDQFDPDSDGWHSKWLLFTTKVLSVSNTPTSNQSPEVDAWIDECVNNFCQKYKVLNRLNIQ